MSPGPHPHTPTLPHSFSCGDDVLQAGMHAILRHPTPDDFVLATGKTVTVRSFVECAFRQIGVNLIWSGFGANEVRALPGMNAGMAHSACQRYMCAPTDNVCMCARRWASIRGIRPSSSASILTTTGRQKWTCSSATRPKQRKCLDGRQRPPLTHSARRWWQQTSLWSQRATSRTERPGAVLGDRTPNL